MVLIDQSCFDLYNAPQICWNLSDLVCRKVSCLLALIKKTARLVSVLQSLLFVMSLVLRGTWYCKLWGLMCCKNWVSVPSLWTKFHVKKVPDLFLLYCVHYVVVYDAVHNLQWPAWSCIPAVATAGCPFVGWWEKKKMFSSLQIHKISVTSAWSRKGHCCKLFTVSSCKIKKQTNWSSSLFPNYCKQTQNLSGGTEVRGELNKSVCSKGKLSVLTVYFSANLIIGLIHCRCF